MDAITVNNPKELDDTPQIGTTNNDTPLLLNNSNVIAANSVVSFSSIVTATEVATGDVSVWKHKGAIKNIGGITSLVGGVNSVVSDEIAEDIGALGWVATFTANDATDTLDVTVIGENGHIIEWTVKTTLNKASL